MPQDRGCYWPFLSFPFKTFFIMYTNICITKNLLLNYLLLKLIKFHYETGSWTEVTKSLVGTQISSKCILLVYCASIGIIISQSKPTVLSKTLNTWLILETKYIDYTIQQQLLQMRWGTHSRYNKLV